MNIIPIEFESSNADIYRAFRRIVRLWNDTGDDDRVNDLYNDFFDPFDPDDPDNDPVEADNFINSDLVGDVIHFVSNLDELGPLRVIMPLSYEDYIQSGGLEKAMALSYPAKEIDVKPPSKRRRDDDDTSGMPIPIIDEVPVPIGVGAGKERGR